MEQYQQKYLTDQSKAKHGNSQQLDVHHGDGIHKAVQREKQFLKLVQTRS